MNSSRKLSNSVVNCAPVCPTRSSTNSVSERIEEKKRFEEYRKTCSTVFGKANQSQHKYLQAFSDLQQAMWTSCESIVVKQISALEEYSKSTHSAPRVEVPLQIYSGMIDAYMKWVSAAYDIGVVRLQLYRNNIEHFNDMMSQALPLTSPQGNTTPESTKKQGAFIIKAP